LDPVNLCLRLIVHYSHLKTLLKFLQHFLQSKMTEQNIGFS